jgi:hypothetical protein
MPSEEALEALASASAQATALLRDRLQEAKVKMAEMRRAWVAEAHEIWASLGGSEEGCPQFSALAEDSRRRVDVQARNMMPQVEVQSTAAEVAAATERLNALKHKVCVVQELQQRFAKTSQLLAAASQELLSVACEVEETDLLVLRQPLPRTLGPGDLSAVRDAVCAAIGVRI